MNLKVVASVGAHGIGYTITGIGFTFIVGYLLTRFLKTSKIVSALITVGTAICGGSAIAAVSPVLEASEDDISIALAAVFLLNAIALFIFPPLGHYFSLDQYQFGLWSALAIHDTSSVVGAALAFGHEALEVATTVKLARALWIIPVTLMIAFLARGSGTAKKKFKHPWFILGFILMAALFTFWSGGAGLGHSIVEISKKSLVATLFFIGSGLTVESLKKVGLKPLILAFILWIIVLSTTLYAIKFHFIS